WGLLEEAVATGVAPRRVVFRDATTGEELVDQEVTGEFEERYGAPYIVAHRADLHRVLWKTAEAEACACTTASVWNRWRRPPRGPAPWPRTGVCSMPTRSWPPTASGRPCAGSCSPTTSRWPPSTWPTGARSPPSRPRT